MWLSNSSVGRKVVMSVTGIALILFLTFHMAMNLVEMKWSIGVIDDFLFLLCMGTKTGRKSRQQCEV